MIKNIIINNLLNNNKILGKLIKLPKINYNKCQNKITINNYIVSKVKNIS